MPTYYLGTPVPSGSPGAAQWLDTATLGGAKYNVWQVGNPTLATPIPGTDLSQQAFDYTLTVPAGRIALGDTFNLRFLIQADGGDALGAGGQFKWGFSIGGVPYLSGIAGVSPGAFGTITAPNGIDGVFVAAVNPVDAFLSGTIFTVGSFDALIQSLLNVPIAGPVDINILWEWQPGVDATASASLLALGFEVNSAVP
jgi:hypothetical protein